MLTICFKNQQGEIFYKAMRKALNFDGYKSVGDLNYVELTFDEIIDNWNWFEVLFDIVTKWEETKIYYLDKEYSSKEDMNSFYNAAKILYYEWLEFTNSHLIYVYREIPEKHKIISKNPDHLTNDELDRLIDLMLNNKEARVEYARNIEAIG